MTKKFGTAGCAAAFAALFAAATASGAEFFLRAAAVTNMLPNNGGAIVQWGFARDTAFAARDGEVAVPGPVLSVPPGDTTLTIHLDNDLAEAVSIVIPGQAPALGQTPVRNPDGRVRAFTFETPPGNAAPVNYTWTNLRPGTFLYHSGSHPAVQRPMGLYGALTHDHGAGTAYPNVHYDMDILLFYSEIAPAVNQAVRHSEYGPGKLMSSTVDYEPGYYLLNGLNLTNGVLHAPAAPGARVLVRLVNAGSRMRVPVLHGDYLQIVAEDGFQYPFRRLQYSMKLAPNKTMDALLTNSSAASLAWFDRRAVSNPPQPLDSNNNGLPDNWEEQWFGGFTNAVPDADPDADGFTNLQEYTADTNPLDPESYVRISGVSGIGQVPEIIVGSASAARVYRLHARDSLVSGPWTPITSYLPGAAGTLPILDQSAMPEGSRFYKIEVDLP